MPTPVPSHSCLQGSYRLPSADPHATTRRVA